MTQRLDRPVKKLLATKGPVAIGIFEDGTILVAGQNDPPFLIRNGGVMAVVETCDNGDLVFSYLAGMGLTQSVSHGEKASK